MRIVKLSEVCSFINGDRGENYPSKSKQTSQGIPFINAGHLTDRGLDMTNMSYISTETYDKLGSGKVKPNDILFCLRGSLGKFASVGNLHQGAIASSLIIIRPNPNLLTPEFLLLYLASNDCKVMIRKYKNGAAQPNLSAKSLANFEIKIPSLSEQTKITQKLRTSFEKIDRALELNENNVTYAGDVLRSVSFNLFNAPDTDTKEAQLKDLLFIERGGSPRPIKDFITDQPDGLNWVKIGDVEPGQKYIVSTKQKIKPTGLKKTRQVKAGDFVLSNSMSFGRPYIMKIDGCIHDGWLLLRQKDNSLSKDYLYYFLSSAYAYKQFDSLAAGSTVRNLNTQTVAKVRIHYPNSLESQEKIVKKLEFIKTNSDLLVALYKKKSEKLYQLKHSMLNEAFMESAVK